MANVAVLTQLLVQVPYQPHGFENCLREIRRLAGQDEEFTDGLALYQTNATTTTAVAVKASAGRVHAVMAKSAGTACYVSLWNVAQGGVTVGTTTQDFVLPVSATNGQFYGCVLSGDGNASIWGTAITVAVATTARGNSVAANLPTVWILYA